MKKSAVKIFAITLLVSWNASADSPLLKAIDLDYKTQSEITQKMLESSEAQDSFLPGTEASFSDVLSRDLTATATGELKDRVVTLKCTKTHVENSVSCILNSQPAPGVTSIMDNTWIRATVSFTQHSTQIHLSDFSFSSAQ